MHRAVVHHAGPLASRPVGTREDQKGVVVETVATVMVDTVITKLVPCTQRPAQAVGMKQVFPSNRGMIAPSIARIVTSHSHAVLVIRVPVDRAGKAWYKLL